MQQRPAEAKVVMASQLSKFGKRTTIHGLSHMYQNKRGGRRTFWLAVFILGFVATVVHLTMHAKQFLESPTMVTMEHEGADFEFPDVTICSQTPTTSSFYGRGVDLFPSLSDGLTRHDLQLLPLFNVSYDDLHSLAYKEEIRIHKRLIQHQFASTPTKHKGLRLRDLVVRCSYHKNDCRSNFTLLQHPNYLNCYTFRPNERDMSTTNPEDGLVLLLYAASKHKSSSKLSSVIHSSSRPVNRSREQDVDWFARLLLPEFEPAGVKIIVHEKDALPALRASGFIVGSGQFTEVEVTMLKEESLDKSSSPCLEEAEPKVQLLTSVDERGWPKFAEYNAEPSDCATAIKQRRMFNECGCTTHFLPLQLRHGLFEELEFGDRVGWCYNATGLLLALGLTPTGSVTDPRQLVQASAERMRAAEGQVQNFLRRVACHDRMLRVFSDPHNEQEACGNREIFACARSVYTGVYSSAAWPRHSDIQEIVEDSILPALRLPGGGYQRLAHEIFHFDSSGNWSVTAETIAGNFVKLQLHPHQLKVNVHKEEPAYSIWEALGELGGIFGLWLGVSFLGVIEVIEFFIDFTVSTRRLTKRRSPQEPTGADSRNSNCLLPVSAAGSS